MPTGNYEVISPILTAIGREYGFTRDAHGRPQLLDVGVGLGKWGALLREYFSVWYRSTPSFLEAYTYPNIEGVEAFSQYSNPVWGAYNMVHIKPIEQFLATDTRKWDGITCMDVIEHLSDGEADSVLRQLVERTRGFITLSFPAASDPHGLDQGAAFGNVFETHRSRWSLDRCASVAPELAWKEVVQEIAVIGVRR